MELKFYDKDKDTLHLIKKMCEKHIEEGTIGQLFNFERLYGSFKKEALGSDDLNITIQFDSLNKDVIVYEIWIENGLKFPDSRYHTISGKGCEEIYKLLIDNIHLFVYDHYNPTYREDVKFYDDYLEKYR